MMLAVAQQ